MGTKENKELVRGFWEVAEKGDYDAFGNYITEDSVDHTPMPGQPAGLEGVKYKNRWVVIYSRFDIGCALEKHQSSDCVGYDPESAYRLAAAVVLYALRP